MSRKIGNRFCFRTPRDARNWRKTTLQGKAVSPSRSRRRRMRRLSRFGARRQNGANLCSGRKKWRNGIPLLCQPVHRTGTSLRQLQRRGRRAHPSPRHCRGTSPGTPHRTPCRHRRARPSRGCQKKQVKAPAKIRKSTWSRTMPTRRGRHRRHYRDEQMPQTLARAVLPRLQRTKGRIIPIRLSSKWQGSSDASPSGLRKKRSPRIVLHDSLWREATRAIWRCAGHIRCRPVIFVHMA